MGYNKKHGIKINKADAEVRAGPLSAGMLIAKLKTISNKTADYTVTREDAGTVFTNEGDLDAITYTLPAPSGDYVQQTATVGLLYIFVSCANQSMTVVSGTAGKVITLNDLEADSLAVSTPNEKIGAVILALGISATKWLLIGLTEGVTYTVGT